MVGSSYKDVVKFTEELTEELHKPLDRNFEGRVNVNSIDEIWAADLIDMQTFFIKDNKGIKTK